MDRIPAVDVELPEIHQVAIVVEDLLDGMDRFRGILGIEPWTVYRFESPELTNTTYYGEAVEYGMVLALGYVGDTMIELIESTRGPNVYEEHLERHGEGLHHIAYFGWDEDEAIDIIAEFEQHGMPVIQQGHYEGTDFWYLDTSEELNGVLFELGVRRDVQDRNPIAVYPEEPYPPE